MLYGGPGVMRGLGVLGRTKCHVRTRCRVRTKCNREDQVCHLEKSVSYEDQVSWGGPDVMREPNVTRKTRCVMWRTRCHMENQVSCRGPGGATGQYTLSPIPLLLFPSLSLAKEKRNSSSSRFLVTTDLSL